MKITLILLPGLNGTAGLFDPLVECAQNHFDILPICYPQEEEKSYRELTSYVLEKISSVRGRYIIVGESFSGPVSLFVSSAKPEGLLGLVLVATFITAPNLKAGKFLPWKMGFSLVRPLYGLQLALSKKENQALMSKISTEMRKVSPKVLSSRVKEVYSVNATASLRNCEYPVVYFRGTKDYVVPKKNLDEILSVKPDMEVVEFNAQHFVLQSKPEHAFNEIRKFAEKCA